MSKEYHQRPEASYSKLALLDQSIIKYYNRYILGLPEPVSDALRFGSAFDCYLTEPNNFTAQWTIKSTATTKVEGCITETELVTIKKMTESVNRFDQWGAWTNQFYNYTLAQVFKIAETQKEIYWTHHTGAKCRGKLDYFLDLPDFKIIIDLKSTKAESLEDCIKSFFNYRYYLQAVMYIAGIRAEYNLDYNPEMFFVFVSKTTHETWVIHVSDNVIDYGDRECNRLLTLLAHLETTGEWLKPQPCTGIQLPKWITYKNSFNGEVA